MSSHDFLLVLAGDNVMCFTADGCNTKLSCISSARRHYKQRHQKQPGAPVESRISNKQNIPNTAYQGSTLQENDFNSGQVGYSENNAFQYNHSAGTFKSEPQEIEMTFSSNIPGPSKVNYESPVKKIIKKQFSTPSKAITTDFGTPPKIPNEDFGTPSQIDINISQSPDGSICNICGKVFSNMGNARRHYKTTHEVLPI